MLFLRGRKQRVPAEAEATVETESEEFEYADELPDLGGDR